MQSAFEQVDASIDFFELEDAPRGVALLLRLLGERVRLCVRVVSAVLHSSTKARRPSPLRENATHLFSNQTPRKIRQAMNGW